jgi:hypothetical protein
MISVLRCLSNHLMLCRRSFSIVGLLLLTPTFGLTQRLLPSDRYRKFWAEVDGRPSVYRMPLARHRKLVAVGDTLYLLNGRNRILWDWVAAAPLWDAPVVDSKGTVYLVGYDMLWAAVDSETGKLKWQSTANGRAAFTQIKPYRKDMYLVVTSMWGYRDSLKDPTIKDTLSLCKGNAVLWEADIPAETSLEVRGNKVSLRYKRHGHVVRTRIGLPRRFGKSLGRISAFADYEGRPIISEK